MALTRYYKKKTLDAGHIRGVRDVLSSSFDWGFASAEYDLYYPSERWSLTKIKEVDSVVADHGQPTAVYVALKSQGGRSFILDTRDPGRISIDVYNKGDSPTTILDAMEPVLALEALGDVSRDIQIKSAFLAHGFNDQGTQYANELARFLGLLGIQCESRRAFAPSRVSDKVTSRLAKHDMFVAIASPQEDYTWITQEIATAAALKKHVFVLKQSDVSLKEGILGDHEYIPFPEGQLSKAFIPILEGMAAVHESPVVIYSS